MLRALWNWVWNRPGAATLLGAVSLFACTVAMAARGEWSWVVVAWMLAVGVLSFCAGVLMERWAAPERNLAYRLGVIDGMEAWRRREDEQETNSGP